MKIQMLCTSLPVVAILAACSPAAAPIPANVRVPIATVGYVFPATVPTLAAVPGSVEAQAVQVVQAYQDMPVGSSWSVWLLEGETATLDQAGNVLQVQDAQGRVVLENLGGALVRVKVYAWEDGYNPSVGSGYLLLKAGYSYTQNALSLDWNNEVAEVRHIADDQLVGYALLMEDYDSNGSFTGPETPAAFIDNDSDGLVSIQELDTALAGVRAEVSVIGESHAALAERFNTEIDLAAAAIDSGAIAEAYLRTSQLRLDVTNAVP